MGMDIRKTDTKGRITVGTKGEAYSQTVQPDGTIILKPLIPPKPPVMPEDAPHAVYVDYQLQSDGLASTLTLRSEAGMIALGNQAITLAQTNGNIPIVMFSDPEDMNHRGLALHLRQSLENRGLADAISLVEIEPSRADVMCDADGSTAPQSAGPMHVPEERQSVELSEHAITKLTDAVATKLEMGIAEKGDADSTSITLSAEATEEPPLPREGANGGVPTTTLWFTLHGSESAPEKALLHRAPGDSWGYNLSQDQLDEFVAGHLKGNAKVLFHIVARHIDAS